MIKGIRVIFRLFVFFLYSINFVSVVIFAGITLPFVLLTIFFDKKRLIFNSLSTYYCRYFIASSYFWKVNYIHNSLLEPKKTYIYVSNHQSLTDIPAAFFIKYNFKFISKKSLFSLPVIGYYMKMSGFLSIQRGSKESISKLLQLANEHLENKNSLLFFPEGRRVSGNTILPFKQGAFTLAIRHNVTIVPVMIKCTKKSVMHKIVHGKGRERITVKVLDPITPTKNETAQELAKKSYEVILKEWGMKGEYS